MASTAGVDIEAGRKKDAERLKANKGPGLDASAAEDRMWALYLAEADKDDNVRMENWKGDMDAILIFSYQGLQQDPANVTVLLLAQISMQLAANTSFPVPALSPAAIPFQPSSSMQSINALWFLSLLFSLACALLATFVQQWARQYLQVVGKLKGTRDRSALRAYMARGHERYRAKRVVEAMPALLHVSLFLFFAGLVQFLYTVDKVVACAVLIPTVLLAILYFTITIISALSLDCPYRTPLSHLAWSAKHTRIIQFLLGTRIRASTRFGNSKPAKFVMSRHREREALRQFKNPEAQSRALVFVRESLVGRDEYMSFFNNLPQFLKARDARLAMSYTQTEWFNVWCSFAQPDFGDDEEVNLVWLRSLFAMLHQNVVAFDLVKSMAWVEDQIELGQIQHPDQLPPELKIFYAVKAVVDQTHPPLVALYAKLCGFLVGSPYNSSRAASWSALMGQLFTLITQADYPITLPATEGGTAVQDTIRSLTRKAFIDSDLNMISTTSSDYLENRALLSSYNLVRSESIMDASQRARFLTAFYELLASQSRNIQTPLSTLYHLYIFDLVQEFNSEPDGSGLFWADSMRQAFNKYLEGVYDFGSLEVHFDRLRNAFPYASTAVTTETNAGAAYIYPSKRVEEPMPFGRS
ncbi:hypothetical protein HWV62_12456 [Athelia sp. TMB]|nr:hypothetical protein HWV62_12456 [Athelia sp. TMB]